MNTEEWASILMGFAESGITLKRVEKDEFQQALEKMMENPDLVPCYVH